MSEKLQAKMDDTKGNLKETAGNVLGNDEWKNEGKADQVKGDLNYKKEQGKGFLQGAVDQVVGKTQEITGAVTGNQEMQNNGKNMTENGQSQVENAKN